MIDWAIVRVGCVCEVVSAGVRWGVFADGLVDDALAHSWPVTTTMRVGMATTQHVSVGGRLELSGEQQVGHSARR